MPPLIIEDDLYSLIKSGSIKVVFGGRNASSAIHRFWAKVDKNGPVHPVLRRCWMWVGASIKSGYGIFHPCDKQMLTHRFSWELNVGIIPDGLCVLHGCDNPSCVNPSHLFLGTRVENNKDRDAKGRTSHTCGEAQGRAKLTDEIVRDIRRRYIPGHPVHGTRAMSREFRCSHGVIRGAINGKTWKHVV